MEYVIKILREEKQRLINQRQMFRLALTKNSIDSRNKIDDEISQIERAMVELSNVPQANELLPLVSKSIAVEYAEFCVRCDREKLPLLCLDDYIKQYCG